MVVILLSFLLLLFFVQLVGDKVQFALANNMNVIVCIGENLSDREADKTEIVVDSQLKAIAGKY